MAAARTPSLLALAAFSGLALTAHAQDTVTLKDPYSLRETKPRSYLGLNLGRSQYDSACTGTALVCDQANPNPTARLYAGTPFGRNWGAELGYVDLGRVLRPTGESRAQGLNLSLVGRARVANSWGLFGRVGTTYGRTDTTSLAASNTGIEQGFGLSYGGGVSYEFTPRLSGTLEIETHDLRFAGGARDPVRSTNLGLQYRY